MPYKLSATLKAHTSDVRAVASPTNELVLSASRDSTAISWQRQTGTAAFQQDSVFRAGTRYVNAVAHLAGDAGSKGFTVTGGQEAIVNVFSLDMTKDEPDYSLVGHSENICALDTTPGGAIISGSWDNTAKVWKNWQLKYDLRGHERSVWAVLGVDEDKTLTGSADKTIKLWEQHKCIATFTGHADAVRGLALVPDIGFASCSNDSEIRVWTLGGDLIYSLSGHTSFVYSLSVLPTGDIVSSGEDRSVRVWKDGECAQVITIPAISVWAVSSMPNGDIVAGSSDGVVRVFSASEERWAIQEELKAYEDLVASQALPKEQIGDLKTTDLAGPEALQQPGNKPGQVLMVKNGDRTEAHQWDAASSSWQKIGEVVDAVGQGRRQLYEGKEYDYVFDVDIQDGVPALKLPYNVTENPYNAAQRFLNRNELPISYLDEVVRFIESNTAGVNLGGGDEFVDPFTGASRYRSTAPSGPAAQTSGYSDPFTGGSRYQPAPAQPSGNDVYQDPFTGASRYSGGAPSYSAPAPSVPKILPATQLVSFKQANVTAMEGKLKQFNDILKNEITTSSLAMYPNEAGAFEEIFLYLLSVTPTTTGPSVLSTTHAEALISVLNRWPAAHVFPVIDLARLFAGFCGDVLATSAELQGQFIGALEHACDFKGKNLQGSTGKVRETNILLVLRALANLVGAVGGGTDDGPLFGGVAEVLARGSPGTLGKQQKIALASVLFNLSCLPALTQEQREQVVILTLPFLALPDNDAEAAYRALVALGNTLLGLKNNGTRSMNADAILGTIAPLPQALPEARVKNIVEEIKGL